MHGLSYLVCLVGVNESTHFYAGAFIFMFMYEKCHSLSLSRNARQFQ